MQSPRLSRYRLLKIKRAMAGFTGPTGKVTEQDGNTYIEIGKCPWSAIDHLFPKGWTREEKREALNHELLYKPWGKELTRLAGKMQSRLKGIAKNVNLA